MRRLSWSLLPCDRQYLRVFDLGVEIRRGEIRHRTARQFSHPCMHTTGTKGATHSGNQTNNRPTTLLYEVDWLAN